MSVRRLHLDYVAAPFPAWPGWSLLALGAALAAGVFAAGYAASREVLRLEARVHAAVPAAAPRVRTDPVQARRAEREVKAANEALHRLTFAWQPVFDVVERSAREDVALLGVQPDAGRRVVVISAEAKDVETMLAYWRALAEAGPVAAAHIVRYEIQQREPRRPVRFQIRMEIGGAG